MFSRRTIQRAVLHLTSTLSRDQSTRLVERLNTPTMEQVSAEWEAIVLSSLGCQTVLRHESDLGGRSRPDIHATLAAGCVEFVADVCAVSDSDIEDDNPIEFLQHEMFAVAREFGMNGAGLHLTVARAETSDKNQRRVLALPVKGDVQRFVKRHIRPFLQTVSEDRLHDRETSVNEDGIALTLKYEARERRFFTMGLPRYTWPRTPRHNPLFRALEAKADQLRRSGFAGIKGIVACDAGCEAIADHADKVVGTFFRQHRSTVSFIAVIDVPETRHDTSRTPHRARLRVFWNPGLEPSERMALQELLQRTVGQMPPATDPSRYTRLRVFAPDLRYYNSREGAYMIDERNQRTRIRVSARAVLQALAGDLRHRETWGYSVPVEFFQAQLRAGHVIVGSSIERGVDDDDDWLVLELDGPDAAVSSFNIGEAATDTEP